MSRYQFFASDEKLAEYDDGIFSWDEMLRIFVEDDLSIARRYTDRKYCAYLEWQYSEKMAEIIISYIKEHLKVASQIELWDTWLEEKEQPRIQKCSVRDVSVKDIAEIFDRECYDAPVCLVICRSQYHWR